MRRTERLFQIIQILRSSRAPVTGARLAEELEVSLRTLYRDMAELTAQRVPILGEAGTGYVLQDGYDMPPLMLTADELEAAALGAALVAAQADPSLATAARDLVAKLSEAIPGDLRPVILDASSRPIATGTPPPSAFDGASLRHAIRNRYRLQLSYRDQTGSASKRTIWPLLIAYLSGARYIVAWCETRQDYRHFRTDRVADMYVLPDTYPGRRASLIAGWESATAKQRRI
ncbi:HTH domain protein [Shimia sp. SK013]|uniref:helix-turn-helix transcriptional regulator n=1 Tax=Shimia sp. SK013 TaxID=1389006 RepID=UPI0006B4FC0C|nr:YafY family protein [Shimia sp. SK013]KPA22224.1 HTH domain protein [Shimia sp. SK013]